MGSPTPGRLAFRAALPRFAVTLAYALAMAYVEAAAVLYLRTIYGGIDPVGPRRSPFHPLPDLMGIEIGREAATLVMLGCVGYLAGHRLLGRLGAFVVAFGAWDIGYYLFLRLFAGWPASPLAPDVLFLIPLPWWGPVAAPSLVALLMVAAGGLAMARECGQTVPSPRRGDWLLLLMGTACCLAAFMASAAAALPRGLEAAFSVQGGAFPWLLFGLGLLIGGIASWRLVMAPPRLTPQAA